MDVENGGLGHVIEILGVMVTDMARTDKGVNNALIQGDEDIITLDTSFSGSDDSVDLIGDAATLEKDDRLDDEEMTVLIDEGPTQRKRMRLVSASNNVGFTQESLRNPFTGFSYDPSKQAKIQRLRGLPFETVKLDPLNRKLLDMSFPLKNLPKLKITLPKHENDQHKVVVNDCFEPRPQAKANSGASVSLEKKVVSSTVVPREIKTVEQGSESPSKSALAHPKARESRDWKPSAQYFKPLNSGWVREVIFDRKADGKYQSKPKEINYYSPSLSGGEPRKFQTMSDLGSFLKSTNSEFSLANFSFRMELMNAPDGQEITRESDASLPAIPSAKPAELLPSDPKADNSSVGLVVNQEEPLKSSSDIICGIKVKTFGKLNSPNITNSNGLSSNCEIASKEREPKLSEKGSLIFKVSKGNLNSSPSLSIPKVTITPAVKSANLDSATKVQKSIPSISISPSPKQRTSLGSISLIKPSHTTLSGNKLSSNSFSGKILRAPKPAFQSCSIHCPRGAFQPPELTCNGCYSFFHPVCIGLEEKTDYSSFHFYCSVCSPPVEKKNSRPRTSMPADISCVESPPTVLITQKPRTKAVSTDSRPAQIQIAKVSILNRPERPTPPRPINTQRVVHISGIKYGALGKDRANMNRNAPGQFQPIEKDGYFSTYEVVEGPDKNLVLSKVKPANGTSLLSKKVRPPDGCFSTCQIQRMCSDYFYGLLHVFRYLSIAELAKAAQVCKLWNEVAHHRSLWKSVSLSMCQVKNWESFLSMMEEKKVEHIDFKRIVIDKNEENSWIDHLNQNFGKLKHVTKIEFQKILPSTLENFVNGLYQEKGSRLNNIVSLETACYVPGEPPKALDFAVMGNVNQLEQLRINSITGPLKIINFGRGLSIFGWKFAATLKVLSVLNTDCLTDDHVKAISVLKNLQQLEIGSCHRLSRDFLANIAKLEKLQGLRLERAITGDELGVLSSLKDLQNLELIDNEFKPGFDRGFFLLKSVSKTLVIPVYNEKPETINRNLIDALTNMPNITHFYLGFTNEWLGSLEEIHPNAKGDVIPYQEDDHVINLSLSKLSKKLQLALPSAQKVKILKMWKRASTRQTLANRKP